MLVIYIIFQSTDNIQFILDILLNLIEKSEDKPMLLLTMINSLYRFSSGEKMFSETFIDNLD